jgi:DNA repair protein RadA
MARQKAITQSIEEEMDDYEMNAAKEEKKDGGKLQPVKMDAEPELSDLPGVGPATGEKLTAAGFGTVMAIAVATPGELTEASGMSEAACRKIIQAAREMLMMGFTTGEEVLLKRQSVQKVKLDVASFDNLLGGGLETGAITECFGEFGSGKTQVGHLLAVRAQVEYPGSYVVYIDTENTFRPERIMQFAEGAGLDPHEALRHIKVARAHNSDHQMLLAEKVLDLMREGITIKAVIIDSLTAHFRAEFIGRGTLSERQQKLNKHMHTLLKTAEQANAVVYVTNQVMAKPDTFFGDPTQAIGGHIVAHASTFRIYLRKGRKGSRVAKLIDAPNLADGEAAFFVRENVLESIDL